MRKKITLTLQEESLELLLERSKEAGVSVSSYVDWLILASPKKFSILVKRAEQAKEERDG